MRLGLVMSICLHAVLLGWGLVQIGAVEPMEAPKPTPIKVEIKTISDLTRIRQGSRKPEPKPASDKKKPADKPKPKPKAEAKPKPKPKPAAKPKKVAALPPPSKPKPEPKPAPKKKTPEPKADSKLAPSIAPSPRRKPKPPKKARPKKKVEAKRRRKTPPSKARRKSEFDETDIAALLNKLPDAAPAESIPTADEPLGSERLRRSNVLGQADGQSDRLTISEFDFFMRQIGQCWNPPVGAAGAAQLTPTIAFELNEDGSVRGFPEVVHGSGSSFFRAAAEAAIRAIKQCQPYRLPEDKYKDWAKNEITFDPRSMFGG